MKIHRNPTIEFNCIFGKLKLNSPYLWSKGSCCKLLVDEMRIFHQGRSELVNRALSDFGIEESFEKAAKRFSEHYHYDIGSSAVARTTMQTADQALAYLEDKLSTVDSEGKGDGNSWITKMLVELDGCEIRTAVSQVLEDSTERTAVYNNPVKRKEIKWRDVRLGFVRPLDSASKVFVGRMDTYPRVVGDLHNAALLAGMTSETEVIGVADGGIGLSEELKRQFLNMQFILDKSHLKDHFYETAEALGISKKERAKWVEPRIQAISEGKIAEIKKELEEQYQQNPNPRLKRLIGYLKRFFEAVDYHDFKEKGYPIGSGEIESAHKSIPQKRLKIPGASWHPDSINPILALRIVRANNWWENFWNKRTQKLLAA